MSQEKVERYKQEKANRKQIIKKQKRAHMVRNTIMTLVAVALIGWLGYSAYDIYESKQPRKMAEVDYTAVNEYIQSITEAE